MLALLQHEFICAFKSEDYDDRCCRIGKVGNDDRLS